MSTRVENTVHFIGFMLLIALILFITFFDVSRLTGGT